MISHQLRPGRFQRFLCFLLSGAIAAAPSAAAFGQGFGAQQAVRRSVSGLERGPEAPPAETPPIFQEGSPAPPSSPGSMTGKIDTTFVSPTASVLAVLRPAQLLTSPVSQMFPVEVASAAGVKYLGVDPVDVDEIIAFIDLSNGLPPLYGVTIKFNKPFRAAAIPVERRTHAHLSDLNGKKYLKSAHPLLPSFYGPNNKTLVLAPDAVMQTLVTSAGQPKSGPILDRSREAQAGSDLYVAADVVSLRPLIQMSMAQAQGKLPPEAKPYLDAPNLISAAELTFNLTAPGPTSLVLHGNDDAAAQQIEAMLLEAINKYQATAGEQPAGDDPIQQALARYKERMAKPFQPLRNGTSVTCVQIDGQDPAQRQLTSVAVIGVLVALLLPAVQAAREAARRAQEGAGVGAPPAGGEVPPPEAERR